LTYVAEKKGNATYQIGGIGILQGGAINLQPKSQTMGILDFIRGDQEWSERREGVTTFAFNPLPAMLKLERPLTVIIVNAVSRDGLGGLLGLHVGCLFPNHYSLCSDEDPE
jgi:hypothetical protein